MNDLADVMRLRVAGDVVELHVASGGVHLQFAALFLAHFVGFSRCEAKWRVFVQRHLFKAFAPTEDAVALQVEQRHVVLVGGVAQQSRYTDKFRFFFIQTFA